MIRSSDSIIEKIEIKHHNFYIFKINSTLLYQGSTAREFKNTHRLETYLKAFEKRVECQNSTKIKKPSP